MRAGFGGVAGFGALGFTSTGGVEDGNGGNPPAPGMPGMPPGIPPGMPPPDWFVNCFIICCIIIDCMSCFFAPKILPPTVASAWS